jgi:hypothetical protein
MVRRRLIELPPGAARCIPGHACGKRENCARAMVPPEQGRPVEDFTYGHAKPYGCANRINPADAIPEPTGTTIREYVKGLL